MRIAITGSSGFIGRALVSAFRRGYPSSYVVGLDRYGPPTGRSLDRHVDWEMAAPLAPFLRADRIDHLAHLAFQVEPMRNERKMERINVGGTRHVLDEAVSAGVDHITVLSSATAYGAFADNPPLLTEKAPLRALRSFSYPRHKALVESRIASLRGEHPGLRLFVARPTAVVGPGMDNYLWALLSRPRIADPRPEAAPFQLIDVHDLAAILVEAIARDFDGPLNMAAPGELTLRDVADRTGARLIPIDRRSMRLITQAAWRLGYRSIAPAPPRILDYLLHRWIVDTTRLEHFLTPRWRHDAQSALARMVDPFKS